MAAAYYDIGTAGEMHHNPSKNVLFVAATVAAIATRLGRGESDVRADLERAQGKLLDARRAPARAVRGSHAVHQLERHDGVGDAPRRRGAGRRGGPRGTPSSTPGPAP